MEYKIERELSLPGLADPKCADLSLSEIRKRDCRIIGGDKGDLRFRGYTLDEENDKTIVYAPVLVTSLEGLSADQAADIAEEVLMASFDSIGLETVEHS